MIIGATYIRLNKKGQGKIEIPKSVYHTILSRLEYEIELIV